MRLLAAFRLEPFHLLMNKGRNIHYSIRTSLLEFQVKNRQSEEKSQQLEHNCIYFFYFGVCQVVNFVFCGWEQYTILQYFFINLFALLYAVNLSLEKLSLFSVLHPSGLVFFWCDVVFIQMPTCFGITRMYWVFSGGWVGVCRSCE